MLNYRNTNLYNLPVKRIQQGNSPDGSHWVEFQIIGVEGRPDWVVTDVIFKRNWRRRRWLSTRNHAEYLGYGEPGRKFLGFAPHGFWARRVVYNPPVEQDVVIVHSDAPPDSVLLLSLALSSRLSHRSQLEVRLSQND